MYYNFYEGPKDKRHEPARFFWLCCQLHRSVSDSTWTATPAVSSCQQRFKVLSRLLPFLPLEMTFFVFWMTFFWLNVSTPSSHSTPQKDAPPKRTRLSRTLSDTPSSESEPSDPSSSHSPLKLSFSPHLSELDSVFSPAPTQSGSPTCSPPPPPPSSQRRNSHEAQEESLDESCYYSFHDSAGGDSQGESFAFKANPRLNGGDGSEFDFSGPSANKTMSGDNEVCCRSTKGHMTEVKCLTPPPQTFGSNEKSSLIPMTLYLHRVNSLVLVLLVEPHFFSDTASKEEVVRKATFLSDFIL